MSQHVFISYLRENKDEVRKLVGNLQAAGIEVWWDEQIEGGEIGWDEVCRAIKESYAFVLCLSKEAVKEKKSGIWRELSEAKETYLDYRPGETFIIPVRLSECEIPSFTFDATRQLGDLQYIDLFPTASRSARVNQLINKIQRTLPDQSNLRASFDALEDEKRRKHSGKPKRGSLVPKCCDRKLQFNQLKDFLFDNTQYSLQLPQICIVHGRGDEQHKSLVERFYSTFIRPFAELKYKSRQKVVTFYPNKETLDLQLREGQLLNEVFVHLDASYQHQRKSLSPEEFCKLTADKKERVLIFQHNIEFSKYDKTTVQAIGKYIEFWDKMPRNDRLPEIIVFLNLLYPSFPLHDRSFWLLPKRILDYFGKRRIKKMLHKEITLSERIPVKAAAKKISSCIMLEELSCVKPRDILKWFEEHDILADQTQEEREEMANSFFRTKEGQKLLKCRRMSDIEPKLIETFHNFDLNLENV